MDPLILASKSPRRQELLQQMNVTFQVRTKEVDESFPAGLSPEEAVHFIAEKKARAFENELEDEILIAADTIVTIDGEIIGKPDDRNAAYHTLAKLSARMHQVITAVCLLHKGRLTTFTETTDVYFKALNEKQINFYIDEYQPYDKAGAYGIQEWIGAVAIHKIVGSYNNVVGLPTARLYEELQKLG